MTLAGTSSHGLLSTTSNSSVDLLDFNAIKISIADPDKIRSWSYGEVTKPETKQLWLEAVTRTSFSRTKLRLPIHDPWFDSDVSFD